MNISFRCMRSCRRIVCLFACLTVMGLLTGRLEAALVLSVSDASLVPGGSATIHVTLQSTDPDTDLMISGLQYSLSISNSANSGSLLEFSGAFESSLVATSNYIFEGLDNDPLVTIGPLDTTQANFSDLILVGPAVSVASAKLVGRYVVAGNSFALPEEGDSFVISVQGVEILDENFSPVTATMLSNPGTVTVTAIPEPSSIATLLAIGSLACLRRRRRQG